MAKITKMGHFAKRFNNSGAAVVLINHQKGTCGWVHSFDATALEKNEDSCYLRHKNEDAAGVDILHVGAMYCKKALFQSKTLTKNFLA